MKQPKPRKKIKHVELWLRDDNVLYIIDPNDSLLMCRSNGAATKTGAGDIAPWGDWVRRYSKPKWWSRAFLHFEFLGEFR